MMSVLLRLIITLFVAVQIVVMWISTPHHPAAYVIDIAVTVAALWIFWELWLSRFYR